MWYILYMNKDVIYIEPEDDITDIITKIENAKSKIVALVPPKKASVFRSIVNIKLIARTGISASKTAVLVTTDPSIIKLAAITKIPVAKNLQSAPSVPTIESDDREGVAKEELRESASEEDYEEEEEDKEIKENDEDESSNSAKELAEDENKNKYDPDTKKDRVKNKNSDKNQSKPKNPNSRFVIWFKEHKKIAIVGGAIGAVLIAILIWAFAIAPAATLMVSIKTEINNFSENVSFTTNLSEEDASEGIFYLDEKKIGSVKKTEFKATGQKNVGAKAQGNLIIYTYFKRSGTVPVKAGSSFSLNNLVYISETDATLSWDGKTASSCENNGQTSAITSGCLVSERVKVVASGPGEKYNIAAANSGWSTTAPVAVYSDSAMTGGTDEMVTVVSQADIDKAKNELASVDEEDNKSKLYEEINDDLMVIDSSFVQASEDVVSSPAVGEVVESGVTPTLTAKTTARIFAIDKTKVEEFITEKVELPDDQKIYEIRDPFIENFVKTDSGYSGKLKTSYATGPMITENNVINIVKGKGLGEAQHDIRDINGIASVTINPSFPWVSRIPNNPNKITVILEVKE